MELNRCPFCGEKPVCMTLFQVRCEHCDINLTVNDWNHRMYPKEVEKAIDRMKPHKVIIYDDIRDYGGCATCGNIVNTDYVFCPECGQALDWNE